ncbi:ABC transporter ATP-binding protein [Entomobacter blattae]|uniref:Lipoprotein-releasing system ATP-binding protein LolD n=1 Tax=Entomobacter blattae TaxID=2762277 RepID=A0A7H1NSY7_9PROT|nr:ABC transporter ATP-binding protein [Entomobacter blattae]QNT78897.1 Lipoprotein-releasing system ATP-binding protein LolD [Entomobacter blattae]
MNSQTVLPLILEEISHSYISGEETLTILKGLNLSLKAGEIVGLVAPSGTGKSTLLHIAGLLETPDKGRVVVNGQPITALSDKEKTRIRLKSIGFVYQFHHLLGEFTAVENVMLPMMIAGVDQSTARKRAEELLSGFGLAKRVNHLPGKLSGGEKQRVAIARALANRPQILLADEPTGNLDNQTAEVVFKEFLSAARDHGLAALIATHNAELTDQMDKVAIMENGQCSFR